jgi:hypothetical protein
MQRAPLTPEQRAEWQAKREQRLEQREQMRQQHQAQKVQIEKACQGKRIGEKVNVQWNNRVIEVLVTSVLPLINLSSNVKPTQQANPLFLMALLSAFF